MHFLAFYKECSEKLGQSVVYWPAWEMHRNYLRLVLGLGLVRVSSRVRVRIKIKVRVSITTSWVVNFALFRCYRPVIYTRPRSYPLTLTINL